MEQSGNRKRLTKSQLRVAFHEAGHVVAGHTEGIPVRKATIIPKRDESGHVLYVSPLRGVKLDCDGSDRARLRAESAIIIFLAGRAAQRNIRHALGEIFTGAATLLTQPVSRPGSTGQTPPPMLT
jgi:ATP-dependent Zn protease